MISPYDFWILHLISVPSPFFRLIIFDVYHHGRQVPVTPAASAAPAEAAEPGPVASPEDSDVELTFDDPLWHSAGLQHDGMKMAWL